MRLADEKIQSKFKLLLEEGRRILQQCGWDGREYYQFPSDVDYQRWRSEALNLIDRVCGRKSVHFDAMQRIVDTDKTRHNSYFLKDCVGILEAAFKDYSDGMLAEIRNIVRADLIDDLLSQAEVLLENGYHIPATSLTGAVLEDTLRKLCDGNGITYPEKTNIDFLNTELMKADVYDKLINKEIIAKADLRNNADHGHFDKVREGDVSDMIKWVRRFVSEHLY